MTRMQLLGSSRVFIASVLFLFAFFYGPKLSNLYTPLSHWATYAIATGTVFQVVSSIGQDEQAKPVADACD